MTEVRLFAPFEKVDAAERMVYGYATTEALDAHGEIVKRDAVAAALPEFMRWGNIREMHQPSAVGKAKEAAMDERGLWLGAKIVDDDAWAKVKEGVYSGFSIAGQVTSRDAANPHIITGCRLNEISLVDRPANPEAVFTMFKADLIEKEGRRHSAADLRHIQAMHDHAAALGARCGAEDHDEPGLDEDGEDDLAKNGDLPAQLAALTAECRRLGARLAQLERGPAPARGALRAIAKSDDLGRVEAAGGNSVHEKIKASLRRPQMF
jgi:phage head maturation protease